VFLMTDLVNLAKYQIYLKLMIDGITGDAFSATTVPPADLSETAENEEKVIRVSRERYGKSRKEIEEKIMRWSGMIIESDTVTPPAMEETKITAPALPRVEKKEYVSRPGQRRAANPVPPASKSNPPEEQKTIPTVPAEAKVSPVAVPVAKPAPQMFEAVCDTCEEKIQVPFKPNPDRPTFCKECLKDYQRARAINQREQQERQENARTRTQPKSPDAPRPSEGGNFPARSQSRAAAFIPKENPISLSQISHIAPKKFQSQRKKPQVNLEEVRALLNKTKRDAHA
jgi:CxxC-x17-CxxC domain-containing protein